MKLEFSQQMSEICSNIKFHKKFSSRSGVILCDRTDGPTDGETGHGKKTNSLFSQFCESAYKDGTRGGAVGWGTALQAGRSRVRFPTVLLKFFINFILPGPHYGPGVDSASNRNECQEYFLGVKGGRCVGLTTLLFSCVECLEIWEPQTPGTLCACSGL